MHPDHSLKRLVVTEPSPKITAVSQHHGEQINAPGRIGLVIEACRKGGEVGLCLMAGRRLKTHFERDFAARPHLAKVIRKYGVAARVAEFPNLAHQSRCGEGRKLMDALQQIRLVDRELETYEQPSVEVCALAAQRTF